MKRMKIKESICNVFQLQIVTFVIIFISIFVRNAHFEYTCGIGQAITSEGIADVGAYPWMGLLIYPYGNSLNEDVISSSVVLITYKFVVTSASEIDKYPKDNFRKKSRVILGQNFSRHSSGQFIRVIQYTYHQDFASKYFATLAIVQLEDNIKQELMPVCAPPRHFNQPLTDINAMSLILGTSGTAINVYNMTFIGERECREYYSKNDLSSKSMWPRYVSCARSNRGRGHCLWKSGTALVVKLNGKWHLLGISISGPACEAPSRFLDYTKYVHWTRDALSRIGRVAITRIDNGFLILRRTKSTLQRFGPCDLEEQQRNFYSEKTEVLAPREEILNGTVTYNLTLFEKLEYTCVLLQAWYVSRGNADPTPDLKLRKWCNPLASICAESEFSTLHFHVIIKFNRKIKYRISCYGTLSKHLGAQQMLLISNQAKQGPPLAWNVPWLQPHEYDEPAPYPPPESNAYPRYTTPSQT